jgi:hypothetical protein
MTQKLEALELRRMELHRRLQEIGDFRRGTVSANLRKCGKKNCVCAEARHAGHPQYLWNTTRGSRSEARSLRLGPQVEKYEREVDNYRLFLEITRELVDINEEICDLRPVRQIEDEEELEALKKKLQRKFAAKRSRK